MTPKRAFILDENVLICAQTGQNDRGEPDSTCFELLSRIIRICHSIMVDDSLWGRYLSQLNRLSNGPDTVVNEVLPALRIAVGIADKVRGFEVAEAAPFTGEELIPAGSRDDIPVAVRLAVSTGAVLVTMDEPLREDLSSSGIQTEHNLTVVSPAEALDYLD